jgi:hypothetical protein
MLGALWTQVLNPEYLLSNPLLLVGFLFQVWMFIDAIRREEYIWALFILIFSVISAMFYYFYVYRTQPSATRGFELPGTYNRKRIKGLQAQIHHLDKAHHHAELGDVYFQQGKLDDAEKCYRAAIERDASDPDFHAHLGQCLLRKGKAAEAKPLLEQVARANPKHDYGHTMMAYAEVLTKLGEKDAALAAWQNVLENHSYARARVQIAELYNERGDKEAARKEIQEVIDDDRHAASFERKKDKVWVKRAQSLLKQLG